MFGKFHDSLFPFSESDLDDCRFPCQGNSPRESLSSQYVSFHLLWYFWWQVLDTLHDICTPPGLLKMSEQVVKHTLAIYSSFFHPVSFEYTYSRCSQIGFFFPYASTGNKHQSDCLDQKKIPTTATEFVVLQQWLVPSFFLTPCWFSPPPHSGLLWAVFLSSLTREMGWVQESEPVLRTSLLPALTLSSCWRNTATERWESTVSEAE